MHLQIQKWQYLFIDFLLKQFMDIVKLQVQGKNASQLLFLLSNNKYFNIVICKYVNLNMLNRSIVQVTKYLLILILYVMRMSEGRFSDINNRSTYIQNSYVIYTPKILKFIYNHNLKNISEHDNLNNQTFNNNSKSSKITLINNRPSQSINRPPKQSKKGKIQLHLGQKKIIHLNSKANKKRHMTEVSELNNSRVTINTQPMKSLPNHITVGNFIPNISCNFFSQCDDLDLVDEGQRQPLIVSLKKEDSRKTIQQSRKHPFQEQQCFYTEEKDDEQGLNHSFLSFRKPKHRIFDLNSQTMDISQKRDRSHSRKSIFAPRATCDLSYSKQRSLSKRKKLFQPFHQKSPKFSLVICQDKLQQVDIPQCIFDSWQKFSAQSQSKQFFQSRERLDTVRELRLQESQVRLVQ